MFRTFQSAKDTTITQPCVNDIFKKVLANSCRAFFVVNVRFVFAAKMSDSAQHWIGSGTAKAAQRTGHHELTKLYKLFNIALFSISSADVFQNVMHLLQSFPAGNTFST